MSFAEPIRRGADEFGRDERAFDGASYLYANEDVRAEIGYDVEGAWRHWTSVGHLQGRYPPGLGRTAPRNIDPIEMAARPFGLNVFGPFEAISGLGTAARNLLDAVRSSGVPFDVHPYDVEAGHARITIEELAAPVRYRINLVLANADQIRRVAGLYPDGTFDSAYTIAVWAWELAAFRPDWHASFALVDEVWTNSRFELASIAAASPVPVHLMPLPVIPPPPLDRAAARARFGLARDAFVFLCAFDAGSTEERKNPFAAIAAFRSAFGENPGRVLVVKHHGGSSVLAERLFAARRGADNIRMIGARLEQADQHALQVASDAFVSPHRSEGFGLNLAEFVAMGRPVIGTNYSGSRDFLDATTGYPVAAHLVEVGRRAGPYLQHAVWGEPDAGELVAAMRAAIGSAGSGAIGRAKMAREYSVTAIGKRLRDRLSAIRTGGSADGSASTAFASVSLFVPPDPARARIAWPARLPTFTVLRASADDGLAGQLYPFWEASVVVDAPPPPEDARARASLRGGDLRVRLLERGSDGRPTAILAAEAASGAWLVLLPTGARLSANTLLEVAGALDSDTPPDLVSLGSTPLRPLPPVVVRKARLLAAWAEARDDTVEDLLWRVAKDGSLVHLPHALLGGTVGSAPGRRPPSNASVSIRVRHAEACCSWNGPTGREIDVGMLPARDDVRLQAEAICRGASAEHVVLIEHARSMLDPNALEPLLAWLADRRTGGVDAGTAFATRRSVLARLSRLPEPPATFAQGVAALGLPLVRLPLSPGQAAPAPEPDPDTALSLVGHAARLEALGLFDRDHYLVSSPDVAASGTDPLMHYVEYGWREHRAPNFYFDPVWYRARYMEEGEELDPLLHYARYRHSGVRPARHFDPAWVRRSRNLPPGVDPLRYFLEHRRTENVSPLPEFDPAWYRARRRDIVYRRVDPFEHYMRFGAAEGVNPSAEFDTAFYAARHMSGVAKRDPIANNPLLHYLENRDRQPAITSLKAALRQEIARLQLLGRSFIEMTFCWHDGLPQRIEALRTYLAEPTLTMPFLLVFANEVLAVASTESGDERLAASWRLPFTDDYDDRDICARLAECFADPRCLRRGGRPVLAVVRRADGVGIDAFAARLERRLQAEHGIAPTVELVD